MGKEKFFFLAYCKIYTDNFPSDFEEGRMVSGDTIYRFLTKSCGQAFYEDEKGREFKYNGDYVIWYLATCEKFGTIQTNYYFDEWGFGEANWERVIKFVHHLYDRLRAIDESQYKHLLEIIKEGMEHIEVYTDIPAYLHAKRRKLPWKKVHENAEEQINDILNKLNKQSY